MTAAERRKNYLVEKSYQLKPVYLIAAAFLLIIAMIELQLFMLLKTVLPEIAMLETRGEILRFGIFIMVQLFVIFTALAAATTIHLHRFVGPLARLTKELKNMSETGDYKSLIVRKSDALHTFIEKLNGILSKISGQK
ncbi:MAG: hypothetical protein QME32_01195 [Endomicrobiia bacterium]|nr:hypothetical protein [Endomicrobiia bacterium]